MLKPAALVAAGILLAACDPGYRYRPLGWDQVGAYEWRFANQDLEVEMLSPGGLIGGTRLVPEATVTNLTDEPLLFESALLESDGKTYDGRFGADPDPRWRTVPPRSTRRIPIFFDFGTPLYYALGQQVQVTLAYRAESGSRKEIRISLVRQ